MFSYEVVICTYNGERFITEQLASIAAQSFKPKRIIISDDGSTDGTLSRIKEFAAASDIDINIRIRTEGLRGAEYNFLNALVETSSPYIFLSDQDDVWLPAKVDTYKTWLELAKDPLKPLLLFSDAEVVKENLDMIHASFVASEKLNPRVQMRFQNLVFQNCIQGATVMINQALKERVLLSNKIVMHDWWLGLIAASFGQLIFIPEPLIKYRQHYHNTIGHTPYGFKHILRKLTQFRAIAWQNRRIVRQAEAFFHLYQNILDKDERLFLYRLMTSQRPAIWQFFLFRYRIKRTTRARTLSLYFLR